MAFCESLKGIDFFGKEPEFYFKGRPKQLTIIGRIFTGIYIAIYIIIFCYKLYRMTQRVDITFYDSYSNSDEIPKIRITNDNFSLVFAVYDEDGYPFIDETIYYPEVYFEDEDTTYIDVESCDPDKLSPIYKEYFGESQLRNFYCLSNINFELQPFVNLLRINILPCENEDEDDDYCESKEIIDQYLNGHLFMIHFPDIILTPLKYDTPVKEKINFLNTEIYRGLGQYLHAEMQLVKIETSTNIIGFDFLTEPKTDEFIKFEHEEILPYPGYNIDDDEENDFYPVSIFELQLNDKILLEKRYYIQLIDVLGEIGGLMEIIYSFFGVICSLIADIIYEKTVTNDLFSFNMDKKIILIKKGKEHIFKFNKENKDKNIYEPNKIEIKNYSINDDNNNINKDKEKMEQSKDEINIYSSNNKKKEKVIKAKTKGKIKKIKKNKSEATALKSDIKINNLNNIGIESILDRNKDMNKNSIEPFCNTPKSNNSDITKDKENNNWIVENMNLADIFISAFYCCCKKKKRNVYRILINESMNLVMEKLDIFNIFRNIFSIEYYNYELNNKLDIIKMSEESSKSLSYILSE